MNIIKRTLQTTFAVSGIVAGLFATAPVSQAATLQEIAGAMDTLPEVTIYTAKKFITMDPTRPEATAVAVMGTKILAVGSLKELEEASKGQPYKVDHTFDGKIVTPGFIAQHLHPFLGALSMESTIISIEDWALPTGFVKAVSNHEEYIARLKSELAKMDKSGDKKKPMFTWGYHKTFHGEITRKVLDEVESTRPIFVWHRSCHEFTLNSAALKLCGIDDAFIKTLPKNTQSMCSMKDGHFWETGLFGVLGKLAPYVASTEQFKHGLATLGKYIQAQGITSASEPGGVINKKMTDLINGVLGDSNTPFRFYFLPDGKSLAERFVDGDLIGETEKLMSWGKGHCSYQPKQIKLFADGAIFSQLMQLRDGYTDGHKGEWMMVPDLFAKAFRKYWDAGYQIVVHITGDKGLDMFLDNLESNMRRNPRYDHRCTVVHFGMAQPDQIKRIKRLGALVSGNPYYVTSLAENYSKNGLTAHQVSRMVPMADVEKAGIHFSYHSDMPMAPAQPLYLMDCGVNRTSTFSGKVFAPEQRVSRMGALKAVTIEAAYSWKMEKKIGSIEAGKDANLTILMDNPLTVESKSLKNIKVWGTMFEGKVFPVPASGAKAPAKSAKKTTSHKVVPARLISSKQTKSTQAVHASTATCKEHKTHSGHHAGCVCDTNRKFINALYK